MTLRNEQLGFISVSLSYGLNPDICFSSTREVTETDRERCRNISGNVIGRASIWCSVLNTRKVTGSGQCDSVSVMSSASSEREERSVPH